MQDLPWIAVSDFTCGKGWANGIVRRARAGWYCERLEVGEIVFFRQPPFPIPEEDRRFLLAHSWGESRLHKNLSYRPAQDLLRGFAGAEAAAKRMQEIMRNYSSQVVEFLARFLSPYAGRWSLDFASFRPFEEEGRALPFHKRNDLLHLDAFPSRPTRGGRILRVFTNVHPTKPRVWTTTERFGALAERFAMDAGLRRIAGESSWLARQRYRWERLLPLASFRRSPYDRFMLRFHHYLKENSAFQAGCQKIRLEFPPMATWLVFSDGVPHAVLSGQFALEQTVLIPPAALVAAHYAPIHVLERLCGRKLS